MVSRYWYGIWAERVVVIGLRLRFYKILACRYKTRMGEIDIVAKRGDKVVFIEVKARKRRTNLESVLSERQMKRIKDAANIFIAKNNHLQKYRQRFDFVEVNRFFIYRHYRNFIS